MPDHRLAAVIEAIKTELLRQEEDGNYVGYDPENSYVVFDGGVELEPLARAVLAAIDKPNI